MTLADAITQAATAARVGHPGAIRRRNDLLAYAAARGVRYRTLADLCQTRSVECVYRWSGGKLADREAILNDQAPADLVPPGTPPAPPTGQLSYLQ